MRFTNNIYKNFVLATRNIDGIICEMDVKSSSEISAGSKSCKVLNSLPVDEDSIMKPEILIKYYFNCYNYETFVWFFQAFFEN